MSLLKSTRYDGLERSDLIAYGVGHFINDLTSTCWFNYLLFFLKLVVRTKAASAAVLAGQITDGLATPLVGHFSDKTRTRIGKRKPWYIFGLVLIVIAFLPTFQDVRYYFPGISESGEYAYYLFFPSLFNVGWAALQISHMALVPALSCSRKRRDLLNNMRNTFTFLANLLILLTGFFLFLFLSQPVLEFSALSLCALLVGLVSSLFFIVRIDEPRLEAEAKERHSEIKEMLRKDSASQLSEDSEEKEDGAVVLPRVESLLDWFKMPSFYLYGMSYMGFRLYVNLFGTLMPFYLIFVMKLASIEDISNNNIPFEMASIPLIAYLFSTLGSLALPKLYSTVGRKAVVVLGMVITIGYSVMLFVHPTRFDWLMYVVASLAGLSQSFVLCTGINMISEVIGTNSKRGAFVFGCYSFLDKVANGIAIFFISMSQDFDNDHCEFVRLVTVIGPGVPCLLGCLIIILTKVKEYNKRGKTRRTSMEAIEG